MGYWMACKFEAAPILVGSCQFCALFCLLSFFHTVRDTNKQLLLILNKCFSTYYDASQLPAGISFCFCFWASSLSSFPALYKKEGKKSLARYCFLHYFPSLNVFLIFLTRDSQRVGVHVICFSVCRLIQRKLVPLLSRFQVGINQKDEHESPHCSSGYESSFKP